MSNPQVSIIMGSQSDWDTMQAATTVLTELNVPFETKVVSAHRRPPAWWNLPRAPRNAAFRSSSRGRWRRALGRDGGFDDAPAGHCSAGVQ